VSGVMPPKVRRSIHRDTCTERIDSRWLQAPAIIYSGIGTKAETRVRIW
jgi:hypothetical protein